MPGRQHVPTHGCLGSSAPFLPSFPSFIPSILPLFPPKWKELPPFPSVVTSTLQERPLRALHPAESSDSFFKLSLSPDSFIKMHRACDQTA